MSSLDKIVYVIEEGRVVESAIRNLDGYIEMTTAPTGNAPKFHVRGAELWTWGVRGNSPRLVRSFDTEDEAIEALEETFYEDFLNCNSISWFATRSRAEKFLVNSREES